MIQIDTNAAEDFFVPLLESRNVPVVRQRLDVGDVVIVTEKVDFVLERKTWADLASSLCDGRWSEQQARMRVEGDDVNKIVQFGYIVEGALWDWSERARMNPKALWGALIKAQVRDGFHVFHAASKESSVDLVLYLYEQLSTNGFQSTSRNIATGSGQKRKRDNLVDDRAILVAMLTVIPGMSPQKADVIVQRYASAHAIGQANVSDLAALSCGKRKLGNRLATIVVRVFAEGG
jgi:ERCC4-type nuclease